jgi:DDB1- and CUL4-associated factor 11
MSTVYMTSTSPEDSSEQIPIPFGDQRRDARFGIWSCRFSADGNEVVAGGDGKLFGAPPTSYLYTPSDWQ